MVTFGSLRAGRPSRVDDKVTRLPSARLAGLALARNNGRVSRETLLTVESSNPYRKGTRRHIAFIEGWQWADARCSSSLATQPSGEGA